MTGIDRLSPLASVTHPGANRSADDVAFGVIADIGARVIGWASQSFNLGPAGGSAWAALTGKAAVAVDPARLAQGGDIYGVREIAGDVADTFGASPTEAGELLRSLEDFTRAAALNINALAGAAADVQLAAVGDALAGPAGAGDGIGGVITRIDAATSQLDLANG